jgi:hypothetical protein
MLRFTVIIHDPINRQLVILLLASLSRYSYVHVHTASHGMTRTVGHHSGAFLKAQWAFKH